MQRRLAVSVALVLLASSVASAQTTPTASEVPASRELETHPDEGLMIAGGVVFGAAILAGITILMPVQLGHCYDPNAPSRSLPPDSGYADCGRAPMAAIPFAHLLGGGIDSIIGGPILLVAEIVGLFTFIGGAAHHHPSAPSVTVAGVPGADVGLALALVL